MLQKYQDQEELRSIILLSENLILKNKKTLKELILFWNGVTERQLKT